MKPRIRRYAGKYWPLFTLWVVAIVALRWWLNVHQFSPTNDAWLLFSGAVLIFISVCITLIETKEWTVRSLGVLGLIVFGGGLYGLSSSVALWGWHVVSQHDLNWLRAIYIVSAPLLLISQITYIGTGMQDRGHAWRSRWRARSIQRARPGSRRRRWALIALKLMWVAACCVAGVYLGIWLAGR